MNTMELPENWNTIKRLFDWRIVYYVKFEKYKIVFFFKFIFSPFWLRHRSRHVWVGRNASLNWRNCEKNIFDHPQFNTYDIELMSVRLGKNKKTLFRLFEGSILFRMVGLVGKPKVKLAKFRSLHHVLGLRGFTKIII